jgi:hypothetical protein
VIKAERRRHHRRASDNQAFRRVVMTGDHEQVVVMTLPAERDR